MRLPDARRPLSLATTGTGVRWGVLLALTAVVVAFLEYLRFPAAMLLGAMAAGIALAAADGPVRVPRMPFLVAQGVIGCLIARSITPELLVEILRDWPVFVGAVFSVIAVSTMLGWLLARFEVLPGTTAVWGASPGAATAIVLMSDGYGADARLVALMQYLRVVMVTVVASLVSALWVSGTTTAPAIDWFPPVHWPSLAGTVAVVAIGSVVAVRLRLQAGPMLVSLALAILLQDLGWLTITLPPWLLAIAYPLIGWTIGLRFTRQILVHAGRALPRLAAAIFLLIVVCGGFAVVLVQFAGIDPLTAYLATSPGGADSVAIIAASTPVDVPFVMAMQTGRFLVVLLTGPAIARFVATRVAKVHASRRSGR
ncbi:AbrB family transcriptional regulator [Rhodovulum sp. PH10]|uniref:AbrB family transcriptional regulator n=1 Tax=Rhodovulum sp. PH10 TaxID=1187851 RepID=UPI00058FC1EA|nr:AbrB family transcriptional regulator [Rhodovulum sp. PH10]